MAQTYDGAGTLFRLPDQYQVVEFRGERLSHARTDASSDAEPRWTEITLYRTEGGQYVVQKVGKSLVFHRHDGGCNRGVAVEYDSLPDGAVGCPRCWRADDVEQLTEQQGTGQDPLVDLELDRNVVVVCERASEVPPALLVRRSDGSKTMSGVSQRALDEAADLDDDLYEAVNHVRRVR